MAENGEDLGTMRIILRTCYYLAFLDLNINRWIHRLKIRGRWRFRARVYQKLDPFAFGFCLWNKKTGE